LDSLANSIRGAAGALQTAQTGRSRFGAEFEALLGYAQSKNAILPDSFQPEEFASHGQEHQVWYDPQSGRIFKTTFPNQFGLGLARRSSPVDYLDRLHWANEVFGDDVRFEGITLRRGKMQVITSQSYIRGPHADSQAVRDHLEQRARGVPHPPTDVPHYLYIGRLEAINQCGPRHFEKFCKEILPTLTRKERIEFYKTCLNPICGKDQYPALETWLRDNRPIFRDFGWKWKNILEAAKNLEIRCPSLQMILTWTARRKLKDIVKPGTLNEHDKSKIEPVPHRKRLIRQGVGADFRRTNWR
jgi:hypothetical protein